jgi:hypothetical protein
MKPERGIGACSHFRRSVLVKPGQSWAKLVKAGQALENKN